MANNDKTLIRLDTASHADFVAALRARAAGLQSIIDTLAVSGNDLRAAWSGRSRAAWDVADHEWTAASTASRRALRAAADDIQRAGDVLQRTERAVAAIWA